MGITITDKGTKVPETLKLLNRISSFLFEEQYGELGYFKPNEIENLRKVNRMLGRIINRVRK